MKKIVVGVCIYIVVVCMQLVVPVTAEAYALLGGRMQSTFSCECEPCRLVTIGGPVGGSFMYCAGYRLYEHYNPYPMSWQLGIAGAEVTCHELVCSPTCVCVPVGSGPSVIMVGTSMY